VCDSPVVADSLDLDTALELVKYEDTLNLDPGSEIKVPQD
jgi:hypothetical protein